MAFLEQDDDEAYNTVSCLEYDDLFSFNSFFSEGTGNLKIFHINIRSYNENFDNLLIGLNTLKKRFDIIILTETWLSEDDSGQLLDGYDTIRTTTKRNRNDGVLVFANKSLSALGRNVELGGVNAIDLDFTHDNKPHSLLAAYRTHDTNVHTFIDQLKLYYENTIRNKTYIFAGDINIDILQNDNKSVHYLDTLYEAGFLSCVDKPTRVVGNSRTCLDHIFVKRTDLSVVRAAVLQVYITDHYGVALEIAGNTVRHADADTDLPRQTVDYARLGSLIKAQSWEAVIEEYDVNESSSIFASILNKHVNASTKTSHKPNSKFRKLKPWITKGIICSIRERDRLYKLSKRQPFNLNLQNYFKNYRNRLNIIIKEIKTQYYRRKIFECGNDSRQFWRTVNEITAKPVNKDKFPIEHFVNDTSMTNQTTIKQVTNDFNMYFSQVGKNLAQAINARGGAPVVDDTHYRLDTELRLKTVTEDEILEHVKQLRGNSAPGCDKISAKFLKENIAYLMNPIKHIYNRSIESGIFPDTFKTAKVFPLFKGGEKSKKNHYRPISLLSVFSKVLEKIIKRQLTNYLDQNSILTNRQFGFRKGKNITDALFNLNRDINDSFDKNERSLLVLLDLAKAFDSVDKSKLLLKMESIGIRGITYNWFRSYLSQRKQVVQILGTDSDEVQVEYGVVQGSTLGPILFLIYLNNIAKIPLHGNLFLFADDTALLIRGNSTEEIYHRASIDMSKLKDWFDQNLLTLNIEKTKFMEFSIRKTTTSIENYSLVLHSCGDHLSTQCQCPAIERVSVYKYLGVMLDDRLCWSEHINYLKKKIRKSIFLFNQLNNILAFEGLRHVYFAYVQSIIEGGIIAWGGAYKTAIEPLITTQKAIIRVALKRNIRTPSNELFSEFKVLDIRQLYIKQVLTFLHSNSTSIFEVNDHGYSTRTSNNIGIRFPRLRITHTTTNTYYISHMIYRNLPGRLRDFNRYTINQYKNLVSEWLFEVGRDEVQNILYSIYRF